MKTSYFIIFFLSIGTFCTIGALFELPIIFAKIAIGLAIVGFWAFMYLLGAKKLK